MAVIDGKNAVLGRLASSSAKRLLAGEEIVIINAEKAILTGDPVSIKQKYISRRQRGTPQHGPFFPRQPDAIVRRTVRGMMPYKTHKGRAAMKKLRVFAGVPEELKNEKHESFSKKSVKSSYVSVGEVAKTLGWRG